MIGDHKIVERKDANEPNKPLSMVGWAIIYSCVLIIPGIIGLILFLTLQDFTYFEIIYAIVGVVTLIAMMFRIRARDSHNVKTKKMVKEDTHTPEYIAFFQSQVKICILGLACFFVAGIFFIIYILNF